MLFEHNSRTKPQHLYLNEKSFAYQGQIGIRYPQHEGRSPGRKAHSIELSLNQVIHSGTVSFNKSSYHITSPFQSRVIVRKQYINAIDKSKITEPDSINRKPYKANSRCALTSTSSLVSPKCCCPHHRTNQAIADAPTSSRLASFRLRVLPGTSGRTS